MGLCKQTNINSFVIGLMEFDLACFFFLQIWSININTVYSATIVTVVIGLMEEEGKIQSLLKVRTLTLLLSLSPSLARCCASNTRTLLYLLLDWIGLCRLCPRKGCFHPPKKSWSEDMWLTNYNRFIPLYQKIINVVPFTVFIIAVIRA